VSGLRVEDIRPQALMERKRGHLEADKQFLRDRRARFVRVGCVACGAAADTLEPAWEKEGFAYDRCPACATVLMNPRPSLEVLHEFYAASENYAFWNAHIFPASEDARRERIFRPRVERMLDLCRSLGVASGTLLEVGAGFGTFCEVVRESGAFDRVIALEPSPDLAATIASRGLEVVAAPFEHHGLDSGSVDVLAAFEVLEHLFSPEDFARTAAGLLRPGGLAIVSCPNIHGFDTLLLGRDANAVDHEHLNYFTPASLGVLFEREGFTVEEVLTPGRLDVDLVRSAIAAGTLDPPPLLRHLLVDRGDELAEPLQDFLAEHRLSSHLWLVARRG
jgi:2-polyprenyl-3-methyl-5-hydroxy-6-metoxy-1,4-benzoquinol methylase